jgi:hypothetical protein
VLIARLFVGLIEEAADSVSFPFEVMELCFNYFKLYRQTY